MVKEMRRSGWHICGKFVDDRDFWSNLTWWSSHPTFLWAEVKPWHIYICSAGTNPTFSMIFSKHFAEATKVTTEAEKKNWFEQTKAPHIFQWFPIWREGVCICWPEVWEKLYVYLFLLRSEDVLWESWLNIQVPSLDIQPGHVWYFLRCPVFCLEWALHWGSKCES